MDAWRNARSIEELKTTIEKEVSSLKRDFDALYQYVNSLSLPVVKPVKKKKKELVKWVYLVILRMI